MSDTSILGSGGALPKRPFSKYQKSLDDAHDEIKASGTMWAAGEIVRLRNELKKSLARMDVAVIGANHAR